MAPVNFTESVVEDAALKWLEGLGYAILNGPTIAPGELFAERAEYSDVVKIAGEPGGPGPPGLRALITASGLSLFRDVITTSKIALVRMLRMEIPND